MKLECNWLEYEQIHLQILKDITENDKTDEDRILEDKLKEIQNLK